MWIKNKTKLSQQQNSTNSHQLWWRAEYDYSYIVPGQQQSKWIAKKMFRRYRTGATENNGTIKIRSASLYFLFTVFILLSLIWFNWIM